jgi:porin
MSRSRSWTGSIPGTGALFLIALVASNAMAQSPSSPPPPSPLQLSLTPSQSAELTPPGYLFSLTQIGQEPGQTLKNDGIYLRAVYVNDILADVAGGNKQGTTSTGEFAFGMNLDMHTIAGIPDAAIHVMFDDRTGLNASLYAGTLFGLSGENGPSDTIRLSELSWDQSLLQDHLRLLVGRDNPTAVFAFSDISCAFVSNITCAQPFAWYVNNSGVAFPVSTWGARMTIKPTSPSYLRIGVYQDQPFQNDITEHGFDWGIEKSTGVFIPFEVGYQHGFGSARLPFKYDIGGYYDTGSYTVPPATGQTDLNRRGRTAFYAQAEQTVWRPDPKTNRSVTMFGGVLASTGGYADYPLSVYAGTYVRGPFASRPKDAVGFEATYVTINKSTEGQVIETYNSLGLVAPDHPNQWILEVDYHVAIAPGIQVVPDAQFVVHPDEIGFSNPRPGVDHAFIVGVQVVINLGEALGLPQWMRVD